MDDDAETIVILKTYLAASELPLDVTYCENPYDALITIFQAMKDGKQFDGYVLDAAIPDCDGFTVAEEIRFGEDLQTLLAQMIRGVQPKQSNIVFLTAQAGSFELSGLVEKVNGQVLYKPDGFLELPVTLKGWLEALTS